MLLDTVGLSESVSGVHGRGPLDVTCWLFSAQWVGGGERSRLVPADPSWWLLEDRITHRISHCAEVEHRVHSLFSPGVLSSRYSSSCVPRMTTLPSVLLSLTSSTTLGPRSRMTSVARGCWCWQVNSVSHVWRTFSWSCKRWS